ncbi:hypothetical protein AB7813_14630 [Tardiphaga sp. 20_F10_N6_6]|uniref:hypothetical protein n=1 Tax=Tardiphaga sp. 20_F10_N6_6 TaxID=3240788 RepID=UPI003F8CB935
MTYDREAYKKRKQEHRRKRKERLKRDEAERLWRINFDQFQYSKNARLHAAYLQWHINTGFCRKSKGEKEALLRELLPCDAPFLAMNNPEACIKFNQIFSHHLGIFGRETVNHLVTFTLDRNTKSLPEARSFNIRGLQAWVRREMRGFDFVAHVDIAPYTNFARGNQLGPFLSFHPHIVTSNADHDELFAVRDRINRLHGAFIPGCPAADVSLITPGTLPCLSNYITKEPIKDYRVFAMREDVVDPETGEVTKQSTGRFRQYSDEQASPRVQLAVRSVTAAYHLDKLVFAGGARGRETLKAIRKDALRDLPHSMRSKRQRQFSGCLPERVTPTDTGSLWTRDYSYRFENDVLRAEHLRPWKVEDQ